MVKVKAVKQVARFTDNGDNTVTDTKTGLQWVKDHAVLGDDFAQQRMTWKKAIEACKKLDLGGHKDWRLPAREELESILDLTRHDPAIDPIFRNAQSSWYWTSTPVAWSQGGAWLVGFDGGHVDIGFEGSGYYVRPVRSSK
jgi:hypothetical protein